MNLFNKAISTIQGSQDICTSAINEIRLDLFKTALKRYDSANWEDGLNDSENITISIDDEFEIVFTAEIPCIGLQGWYDESGMIDTACPYIIEIISVTMDGELIHLDEKTEELILNKFND